MHSKNTGFVTRTSLRTAITHTTCGHIRSRVRPVGHNVHSRIASSASPSVEMTKHVSHTVKVPEVQLPAESARNFKQKFESQQSDLSWRKDSVEFEQRASKVLSAACDPGLPVEDDLPATLGAPPIAKASQLTEALLFGFGSLWGHAFGYEGMQKRGCIRDLIASNSSAFSSTTELDMHRDFGFAAEQYVPHLRLILCMRPDKARQVETLICDNRLTAYQPGLSFRNPRSLIQQSIRGSISEQMDSTGSTRAYAVKQEQKTARYVAEICLGPATVIQKDGLLPTEDPLKLTLIYPVEGVDPELPWIFLLPGANCYSQDYTFLETQMASNGYLVAVVDQLHPITTDFKACLSPVREPQCPNNSWGTVTAAALNDVYNFLSTSSQQDAATPESTPPISEAAHSAIASLNLDSVVMIGHSLGAKVACLLLSGFVDSRGEMLSSNYSRILDSQGHNILKGLIAFDGCHNISLTEANQIAIPDSAFVTYISPKGSISNTVVKQAFEKTEGKRVQYVELNSGNHYAINDWNPASAPHQRAPCGLDNQSSNTVTTQEEHQERLTYMVKFVDAKIRAEVLHETAASSFLREHLQNKSMVVRTRNVQEG